MVPTVGSRVSLRKPSHDAGLEDVIPVVFVAAATHGNPDASHELEITPNVKLTILLDVIAVLGRFKRQPAYCLIAIPKPRVNSIA
jgi:hypothetical protein